MPVEGGGNSGAVATAAQVEAPRVENSSATGGPETASPATTLGTALETQAAGGTSSHDTLTTLAAGTEVPPSPGGAAATAEADAAGVPPLAEQQRQFAGDVDAAMQTELSTDGGGDATQRVDTQDPAATATESTPQPRTETTPAGEQTEAPTAEAATTTEGEKTAEQLAQERLQKGLEMAGKMIGLPGMDNDTTKGLLDAMKDKPDLIDALHGPLMESASSQDLILKLTEQIRAQDTPENTATESTDSEAAPQTAGATSESSPSQGGSGNTNEGGSGNNASESQKAPEGKQLSKTKKLLLIALLILMGISLSPTVMSSLKLDK